MLGCYAGGPRACEVEGRANIRLEYKACSISGNQPLDTATSTGRLMLAVIGAVGQSRAGLALAEGNGIKRSPERQQTCLASMPIGGGCGTARNPQEMLLLLLLRNFSDATSESENPYRDTPPILHSSRRDVPNASGGLGCHLGHPPGYRGDAQAVEQKCW